MECGKLTAKLREIEIPDELKKLPFADFKFDIPPSGAITFKIHFEQGVLPDEWPQARERKSRKAKPVEPEIITETAEEVNEQEGMADEQV